MSKKIIGNQMSIVTSSAGTEFGTLFALSRDKYNLVHNEHTKIYETPSGTYIAQYKMEMDDVGTFGPACTTPGNAFLQAKNVYQSRLRRANALKR
ncbi:MAG: hypothetical protein FWE64_01920 [Alphaproteobacteria bacterium]|nr:hypothetical protein [Alphaproteobacteria bacterium]